MRCPTDGAQLVMAERQGVEIDYCPTCRGIWLDRGELDKILDRAAGTPGAAPVTDPGPPPGFDPYGSVPPPAPAPGYGERYPDDRYRDDRLREGNRDDRRYDDRRGPVDPRYGKKKRRESWLGDLLDFD